jgi:hypothetical protein
MVSAFQWMFSQFNIPRRRDFPDAPAQNRIALPIVRKLMAGTATLSRGV